MNPSVYGQLSTLCENCGITSTYKYLPHSKNSGFTLGYQYMNQSEKSGDYIRSLVPTPVRKVRIYIGAKALTPGTESPESSVLQKKGHGLSVPGRNDHPPA